MPDNFNFHSEAEDLLQRAVKRFAGWAAQNWQITKEEAQTLTKPTSAPSEYARGYNDAITSITDAADTWMEDGCHD